MMLRLVARLDTGAARVPDDVGVPVVDLPNTALVGVAEHTILLMMALSRQLLDVAARTQAQQWLPERSEPILTDQRRYTYNWIGAGRLWRALPQDAGHRRAGADRPGGGASGRVPLA